MNFIKKIALFATLALFFGTNIYAQGLGDPECDPILGCPIDDNIWVLFIAAVLIAFYKMYQNKKNIQKV